MKELLKAIHKLEAECMKHGTCHFEVQIDREVMIVNVIAYGKNSDRDERGNHKQYYNICLNEFVDWESKIEGMREYIKSNNWFSYAQSKQ